MITQEQLKKLKTIPIAQYLESRGYRPEHQRGNELVYYSPLRRESTPSFFVNEAKNAFHDFGGEKGDIVRLVRLLNHCDFPTACKALENWAPCERCNPPNGYTSDRKSGKIHLKRVAKLQHPALIRYAQSRNVPFLLAAKYCKEVYYENAGKTYFSIGFQSDKGGFELRNKIGGQDFKACISPKGITTLPVPGSTSISVFEGFFDFLSALVYFKRTEPRNSVLVLNSTSNLKEALPYLAGYTQIFTFLDNDPVGIATTAKLSNGNLPVIDKSSIYGGFQDFSEMVCRGKN